MCYCIILDKIIENKGKCVSDYFPNFHKCSMLSKTIKLYRYLPTIIVHTDQLSISLTLYKAIRSTTFLFYLNMSEGNVMNFESILIYIL